MHVLPDVAILLLGFHKKHWHRYKDVGLGRVKAARSARANHPLKGRAALDNIPQIITEQLLCARHNVRYTPVMGSGERRQDTRLMASHCKNDQHQGAWAA